MPYLALPDVVRYRDNEKNGTAPLGTGTGLGGNISI